MVNKCARVDDDLDSSGTVSNAFGGTMGVVGGFTRQGRSNLNEGLRSMSIQ